MCRSQVEVVRECIRNVRRAALLLVIFTAACGASARMSWAETQRQLVLSTQAQVRKLSSRFAPTMAEAERRRTEAAIRQCIRSYVEKSARGEDFNQNRAVMMQGLKKIVPGDVDEPPLSFVADLRDGRSLVIFYAFGAGMVAGSNAADTVLDAFHVGSKGARFVGSTGSDMNGYLAIDVKELPSPVKSQLWLLLSGQMAGANGPITRMRVYAFDGKRFRTRWMPANIWGDFHSRVTSHGFAVTGTYYYAAGPKMANAPVTRDDRYYVASDGIYLVH